MLTMDKKYQKKPNPHKMPKKPNQPQTLTKTKKKVILHLLPTNSTTAKLNEEDRHQN